MKKKIVIILALAVIVVFAGAPRAEVLAYGDSDLSTADALFYINLFLGYGETYGLDDTMTRTEAFTSMVRLLGVMDEAENGHWTHPFTDVPAWADNIIGYCYQQGLINGTSETTCDGSEPITTQMFCAVCMRALGFRDTGSNKDFSYKDAVSAARQAGVLESDGSGEFLRSDAVGMMWNSLMARQKGANKTLADKLIANKVFTRVEFEHAKGIKANGRAEGDPTGEKQPLGPGGVPDYEEPTHVGGGNELPHIKI